MRSLFLLLPLLAACTDSDKGSDTPSDEDSGDVPSSGRGLPEGTSEWEGSMVVNGTPIEAGFVLENDGGDLSGTLAFSIQGMDATFGMSGTLNPYSGLVGLVPTEWVSGGAGIFEMNGFLLTYDPETGTLEGVGVDSASPNDNTFVLGAVTATMVSGDGAPTEVGSAGKPFPTGTHTFAGTFKCSTQARPIEGELTVDADGALTGWNTFWEEGGGDPVGTHGLRGVYNPDTGAITMLPDVYTEMDGVHNYSTSYRDGSFDPDSGVITATVRNWAGGCEDDGYVVTVE